jgi:sodium pump decarboxylase gamma subunit
MILDGVKLAIVGIAVVFAFLALLIMVVRISTKLLRPYTEKEAREMAAPERKRSLLGDSRLIAVISAAISAHRERTQNLRGA